MPAPPPSQPMAATNDLRPLTPDDLAAFITRHGITAEIVHLANETPTVEDAARALGTDPNHIAKSLLFLVAGSPTVVIACGPSPVSRRRLAAHFKVSPKRIKLADPQAALAATGYPVGALPPFGHRRPLPTLIDRRVLAQDQIFAGGGSIHDLLRVNPRELARLTGAAELDLIDDAAEDRHGNAP